jgi:hypothetical protein
MQDQREQKKRIIRMLGSLKDHEWVVTFLKKYTDDKDEEVKDDARRALEKAHANTVHDTQMREAYKKRNKE